MCRLSCSYTKHSISHFMAALESLDFCIPGFSLVVWDWIIRWQFFFKSGFCCIYWISSALSSLTQRMCTCLFDWQPMGPKWVIHCSFVCTPSWDMWKIQDSEAKTMATSYVGLCQSQIGAAKAQSWEHVVLSRAVLAVSAYCLQHLTIQHEVSCSGVKFSGPQKCCLVCTERWACRLCN